MEEKDIKNKVENVIGELDDLFDIEAVNLIIEKGYIFVLENANEKAYAEEVYKRNKITPAEVRQYLNESGYTVEDILDIIYTGSTYAEFEAEYGGDKEMLEEPDAEEQEQEPEQRLVVTPQKFSLRRWVAGIVEKVKARFGKGTAESNEGVEKTVTAKDSAGAYRATAFDPKASEKVNEVIKDFNEGKLSQGKGKEHEDGAHTEH